MSTTPIGTGADFDDSNVAMMASDEAHDAMREAAAGDKEWKDAGTACGVEIWRVENHKGGHFGIKRWPQEQFGKFYTGDAYIVLHTKPEVDGGAGFDWDIYFWLGKECSQDERGVAAYKTVELDELLGGSPTQHRIVNPHESAEFLTLFDGMPTFLEGGIESGFNHVEPEAYKPRLLWVKGKKSKMRISQAKLAASAMNQGDVFILDLGLKVLQWNGTESSVWERQRAGDEATKIKAARGRVCAYEQIENDSAEFFAAIEGTVADVQGADEGGVDTAVKVQKMQLYRLSEQADGTISFTVVATGKKHMKKELLDPTDAFVLDCGRQVYVWIGSQASKKEKSKVWEYAEKYCAMDEADECTPITVVHEKCGSPPLGFVEAFKHRPKKAGRRKKHSAEEKAKMEKLSKRGEAVFASVFSGSSAASK